MYYHPYVLLKTSEHPYSTLNILINVFINDEQGYLLGKYGPETAFNTVEDLVITKTMVYNDKIAVYQSPNIIRHNPLQNDIPVFDYRYDEESGSYQDTSSRSRLAALKINELCYEVPLNVVNPDYNISLAEIEHLKILSWNLVSWVIEGTTDLDSAIEQYRKQARNIGLQDFLDEQNRRLGKSSGQSY